jgi:hypothetical protein
MFKRDYDKEIREILLSNGGCVTGFNKLMDMKGKHYFHPNFLKLHLEKLKGKGKITIEPTGNKLRYCLTDTDSPDLEKKLGLHKKPNLEKEFKKFIADLLKLKNELLKPNIKENEKMLITTDFIKIALRKYDQLNVGWLYAKCCSHDKNQVKIIESSKRKILDLMKKQLNELDEIDRKRIINTFTSF